MPILANVIQDAFSPLISVFESVLVFLHNSVLGGSWGLSIVGLTILIRAILVPLTFRQLKSMQEMQRYAPEIQAIKEKYKDDKQRQQQEMMNFYKERKINPLASCLPLLLQLPVFLSLFYMLRTDLKLDICGPEMREHFSKELGVTITKNSQIPNNAVTHMGHTVKGLSEVGCNVVAPHSAKFLFLPDITEKATGAALIALIVLYVGSQVGSTLIATATADPNQRRLMLLLPLVFVVILYRYPAGLLVYWITTNLWTIVQQYVIKRRLPPPPKPDPAVKSSSNGKPTKSLRESLAGALSPPGASPAPAPAGGPAAGPAAAPPPPPRKKKKRSGRRR